MRHIVVYPLARQIDYTELRYSLRSIEKYLKPEEVVIVGDHLPEWITNVTQIELPDVPGQPNYSVRRKIIAALNYAEEFIFMNDDIYLLEKSIFPYYSCGLLKTKAESGARSLLKQLEKFEKPGRYYGHYPCIIQRDFIEIISKFSNEVPTKSAYCNFAEVDNIEISDCKILTAKKAEYIKEFIINRPFSTGAYSIKSCLPVLQELFPEPSIYEA